MKNKALLNSNSFLVLFFFTSFSIFSQTVSTFTPKINSIPTSPEAALLGRFGDIPIGYYTGTANISIPIYSIKDSGIEIPIALNYHSSGIKVEDQATWVGLGWDLSPGGSIIQEVRGKRDELDNNLNYSNNTSGYNRFKNRFNSIGAIGINKWLGQIGAAFYNPCVPADCDGQLVGSLPTDDATEVVDGLLTGSGQPDIYHYNFANYSGKFYINPETQQIVQIDKKIDFQIEKTSSGISITTLDGVKYLFNTIETAYEQGYYANSDRAGKTFKLSEIQLINGKKINFNYIDAHYIDYSYSESSILYDYAGGPTPVLGLNTLQSDIKILSNITTSDMIINFNLESREDIIANTNSALDLKRLKSILITSSISGKKIKAFEFSYSYFPYSTLSTPSPSTIATPYEIALGKRLKLDNLKEVGYTDDTTQQEDRTKPAHKFEYDLSNTMPLKISLAKDFWGYYNAQVNQHLLPDLTYFDYPHQYLSQTNNILFTYNYTGANRYTNNATAGVYMLNKIIYPTGGYSQFEYEPNSFKNQFIPDIAKNNIVNKNYYVLDNNDLNNTVTQPFPLSKEVPITFSNRITATNVNGTPWTYAQMASCYIEFTKTKPVNGVSTTTVIKRWDFSTMGTSAANFNNNGYVQWDEIIQVPYDSSPSVIYTVKVFMPDNLNYANNFYHSSSVSSRITFSDDSGIDTSNSNQCGMRIRSIKNYDRPGNLLSNKQLSYYGGKLLNHFDPIDVLGDTYNFTCTFPSNTGGPGAICPIFAEHGPFTRLSISSGNLISEGGNLVGYDTVEETELSTNTLNTIGKKSFNYYNFDNVVSKNYPVFPNLRNGLIANEYVYDNLNQLLSQKTYNYSNLNSGIVCYYGFTINTHFSGSDPHESATIGSRHKYSYNAYPILSEWNMLNNTVTKEYLGANILTSTENYIYNSQGNNRTTTSINSNDDQLSTTYYYANDYPNGLPIENTMVAAKMTGIPLVTESRKNTTELLSKQNTQYIQDATTGNIILPKYVFAGKGINQPDTWLSEKKVTYDKYDSRGNIQQYTLENGASVTILWGYNKTLPIAKIENATYAQIAAALSITTAVLDTYDESKLTLFINPLRTNASLANSPITTYTYRPLFGVTTITDPKGDIITYTYDALGRLINVKDRDNNILSENKYQYKN